MIKFFDLIDFKQIFHATYRATARQPKLGRYSMVAGLLMLLFIGFNRIFLKKIGRSGHLKLIACKIHVGLTFFRSEYAKVMIVYRDQSIEVRIILDGIKYGQIPELKSKLAQYTRRLKHMPIY